jgi:hypothetical protein
MNLNPIDVGAFSWARIQRLYDADAVVYWRRYEAEGLQCPQGEFAATLVLDSRSGCFKRGPVARHLSTRG